MIKLKIAQMREQFGFEELRGDIEDRTAQIKSRINLLKYRYFPTPVVEKEPEPLQEKKPISVSDKLASLKKKV